jgi:hypothetical protein
LQRQTSKLASVRICPCEQSVSCVKRDAVVVLLEVLDSCEPAREHRRRSDRTRVEVIEDGQAVENQVPRQDRTCQGERSKARDVHHWFQDRSPVEAFVT